MAIWLGFFLKIFLYWLLKFLYFSIFIEGKLIGWEVFSLNKVSSNHWFREIKEILLGDTSVYKSEVVTLFKLSSKSAIIIESKPTLPNVSFFSRFCIFFSTYSYALAYN